MSQSSTARDDINWNRQTSNGSSRNGCAIQPDDSGENSGYAGETFWEANHVYR